MEWCRLWYLLVIYIDGRRDWAMYGGELQARLAESILVKEPTVAVTIVGPMVTPESVGAR